MPRIAVADDVAAQIRHSQDPIELVDASGQTVRIVRRPPSEAEIERTRSRASQGGTRLSWAQVVAKVKDAVDGWSSTSRRLTSPLGCVGWFAADLEFGVMFPGDMSLLFAFDTRND